MRTCPNPECGTQNADDARFCVVCGTRLTDAKPAPLPLEPTVPISPPVMSQPQQPQQPISQPPLPASAPQNQWGAPTTAPPEQNQWGAPTMAPPEQKRGGIPLWLILGGVGVLLLLCVGGGVGAYALVNAANESATATAVAAAAIADSTSTAEARVAARTATAEARATSEAEAAIAEAETATAEAAIAEAETATAAAAEPTPEEGVTPEATDEPVVADDALAPVQASFTDDEGWYADTSDEVDFGLVDGAYRFNIKVPQQIAWDEFDAKPTSDDYLVRVRGRIRENIGGLYAVFNYVDSKNFYAFGISSDGQYRLTARQDGALLDTNIIDWKSSDAINQGNDAENEVEVARHGTLMDLYINGQRVETFEDARFTGGLAGVAGESYDKTGSVVDITGFSVSPLVVSNFEAAGNPENWSEEDTDVVHTEIEGPTLAMTIKVGDSSAYASRRGNSLPSENFVLQTDLAAIENPNDVAGGLYFNYDNSNENFYRVLVWSGGQYMVMWVKDQEFETLVDWTDDSNIKKGSEVNQVRVERVGSSIRIWINGAFVKQVDNLTLTSGSMGVGIASFKTGNGGKVLYDNVVMGALP